MEKKVLRVEEVLREHGFAVRPVVGTSMMPMLCQQTDTVHLIPITRPLVVGDVPLFRRKGSHYVLHRIVKVKAHTYVLRGDNCYETEEVKKSRMVAVLEGFYKNGTYVPVTDAAYLQYVQTVLAVGMPLIPEEWRYLVKLLQVSMTDLVPPPPPEGISYERLLALAKSQRLAGVIAAAVERLEPPLPAEALAEFRKAAGQVLRRELLFDVQREALFAALEEAKIDYMPLKGIVIKDLYPAPGMREYCDHDILYDSTRQMDVYRIMNRLGFHAVQMTDVHDVYQKEPIYDFEMHKALFRESHAYAAAFRGLLSRSPKVAEGSYMHKMCPEDFYLFFLAHFAKHHLVSGGGLRMFADLYLIERAVVAAEGFDHEYVDSTLGKIGLLEFESEVKATARSIFEDGTLSDKQLRYILGNGLFGSNGQRIQNGIEKHGKWRYFWKRIFLPLDQMRGAYPSLLRFPFLLPFFWVYRLFRAVLRKGSRQRVKEELSALRKL